MSNTPTPHISAKNGEIAKTVLLPGDPLRAKMIAEKFLEDAKCVSDTRNNYCYTGFYKNHEISVMSTGMGCGSMGIYSYELFNFYNVENAIRVGTIGSISPNFKIKDVIVAKCAVTDTNYDDFFAKNGEGNIEASKTLLAGCEELINEGRARFANVYTTDTFYMDASHTQHIKSLDVAGVEMECAALYLNAKKVGKNALCICTVSDEILTGRQTTSDERQNAFLDMIALALDLAINL